MTALDRHCSVITGKYTRLLRGISGAFFFPSYLGQTHWPRMTVYRIQQSHLTLWHAVLNSASGQGGVMGNEATRVLSISFLFVFFLHTNPSYLAFVQCCPTLVHIYSAFKELSLTLDLPATNPANRRHTAPTLLFTCLNITSIAHSKSHQILPLCVSQTGAPVEGKPWLIHGALRCTGAL